MRRPGSARLAACAGLCVLGLAASALAEEPVIYKWVDSNGVAHYTTDKSRIPSSIRDRVERREPAVAPAQQPAVTSQPPGPAQTAAPVAAAPPVAPAPEPARPAASAASVAPTAAAPAAAPAAASAAPAPGAAPATASATAPTATTAPVATSAPPAAVSNLARDAVPAPAQAPSTAVSSPPPFAAGSVEPTAPNLSAPADASGPGPKKPPIPSAPATIEPEGVPPEPTGEQTRTATAEIGPRKPVDATELADLDHQIAVLEDKIAKDEDALTALISVPEPQRKGPLVDDPKFREIAKRLPKLQADLQSLRDRRGQVQLAPAPAP